MVNPMHRYARAYIAAVEAGELPDDLCCDDMTAWLTSGATLDKAGYQGLIRLLARMCKEPIRFTLDAITAEDNRVIAEARSRAVLIDGQTYENTYVFALTIRDGKFAHIAEHYNALEVEEKLMPLMARLEADGQG